MEQLIPPKNSHFTVDEYLQMEETAGTKHEFRHGKIIDMAGGSFNRARVAANLLRHLGNRLEGKPCSALGSDLRVRITGKPHYCYPDVSVACGPPVFDPPDRTTTITNPQVVVEVTSPSTLEADGFDKFDDYMCIPSLQEYILVSQTRMNVKTFFRHAEGIWAIGPSLEGDDAILTFRSLGITIPLAEIYAGVEFPKPEPAKDR